MIYLHTKLYAFFFSFTIYLYSEKIFSNLPIHITCMFARVSYLFFLFLYLSLSLSLFHSLSLSLLNI